MRLPQSNKRVDYRISTAIFALLMSIAAITDLVGLIPWIGLILTGFGYCIIGLWLSAKNVSPLKLFAKRKKANGLNLAIELGVDLLGFPVYPGVLINTWLIIKTSRGEDEARYESETGKKAPRSYASRFMRKAINNPIARRNPALNAVGHVLNQMEKSDTMRLHSLNLNTNSMSVKKLTGDISPSFKS